MDLAEYLSVLEGISRDFQPSKQDSNCLPVCTRFYQAFVDHVTNKKVPTDGALAALASTLSLFCKLRLQVPADLNWDQLGHVIFIEAARVVLGLDFQKLDDSDPSSPKALFKKALNQAYIDLQDTPCGQFFLVLQWLVVNGWTHPVLQDMMKGSEIEEEKVQTYLRSGEYPEIFRLRVDMLMENGCDDFALNLATWCTKSPIFQSDPYIRQAQLLLLIKLNRQEEFHNACWQIWQLQCCLSLCILKVILSKGRDEDKRPLLTLTQTFLVHDWMKPDKYCCTEPLLKFWLSLEREQEPNADVFIQSVSKMEQLASNARQLQILVKALSIQFPGEFLQFSLECMLRAIRLDRNKLDTARIYVKDDKEADQAADNLARSCLVIALMFKDDIRIQLSANMTAFYLDPTEDMYQKIKKAVLANQLSVKNRTNQPASGAISDEDDTVPQEPIVPPSDVDGHTFFEVMHAVDTLRPNTLSIYSSWTNLQKQLRATLEEAGYIYNYRKDTFMTLEERMIRRRKVMEKVQRKKCRDDVLKPDASLECLERENTVDQPACEVDRIGLQASVQKASDSQDVIAGEPQQDVSCNQSLLLSGCPGVIDAPKEAVSIPLLDITLDELQQVLDNSSHSKAASSKEQDTTGDGSASSLSSSKEKKESTEDIMVNSIKEFLKGGDVPMQGLTAPSQPSQHMSVCDGSSATQTVQQPSQPQSSAQLIQHPTVQSAAAYAEKQQVSETLSNSLAEVKSPQNVQASVTRQCDKTMEVTVKNESTTLSTELTEPTVFNCKYCGKAYSSMRQRRRHQEWLCKSKVNAAAGEKALIELVKEKDRVRSTYDDSSLLRDDYGNYLCEVCRRPCGTISALKLHQRRAHSSYKGKTSLPSGVSIKECSVKLDRLEDAPVPKIFKKLEQMPEKGKGKEGISKLLSKKYSTGFFLSSLNAKYKASQIKKEVGNSPSSAASEINRSGKTSGKVDTSASERTGKNNELALDSAVDLNAGDAKVELFAPSDDSHPVLCDLCGAVCSSYQTMKEHQAVCALSVKTFSPEKGSHECSTSNTTKSSFSSSVPTVTVTGMTVLSSLNVKKDGVHASPLFSSNQKVSVAGQQLTTSLQAVPQVKQNSPGSNKSSSQAISLQPLVIDKDVSKQNQLKNKPNRNLSPPPKPRKKLITLSYRTCLTCNLEFSTASTCFQHQSNMSHFQGGVALVTKYKCAECGQIFGSSREGESHLLTHEDPPIKKKPVKSSKKSSSKSKDKTRSPPAKPAGEEIFKSLLVYCQYCKKGFLSQTSLDNHLRQGCEARPAVNNMMIVQPSAGEGFDVGLSPVASLIQYNTPQIVQAVDAYSLTQITPGVTNEIVVMTDQVAPEVVLDPVASSYITTLPDPSANPGVVELSALPGQIDPMMTSPGDLAQPTVLRQEMGTQVDIDNVPLAELENDMKELAPDLICNDAMLDSTDLIMDGDQKYPQEGGVQVETITYKNVSMLQHRMWLCSECNMEFALKKDVFWHWEQSTCKEQGAKITDAVNYQCIYCGEMFSEATDCRDHQLASCLKAAGMQVQLLKNRHFHCRMCKGRYYERDHVEKHLGVYHRLSKKEVEAKIKDWFPDSYVRSIEEMLRSKKQGRHRYHHSDNQDANKKNVATVQLPAGGPAKLSKIEPKIEPLQSPVKLAGSTPPKPDAEKAVPACSETSSSVPHQIQVSKSHNLLPTKVSPPGPVSMMDTGQNTSPVLSSIAASTVSAEPAAVTVSLQPVVPGPNKQCVTSLCLTPAGSSTIVSATNVQGQCLNMQASGQPVIVPLPPQHNTATVQMSSDVQSLDTNNCGSPVPTCNISWSTSPGGTSAGTSCLRNTDHLLLPAPSVPDKSGKKSKKGKRSSSTESQLSSASAKEKKSRGRSPVAPPEYHPCPKCGKVIEDRIALQIHLEFICGKSPSQISPARTPPRTPQKSSKKRRRQNSQGSSYSVSLDTSDSRSIVSDDGSMSSASRANTPSHAGAESDASQAKCQSELPHWKCNFCAESFNESADLERHVLATHTQILNFTTGPQSAQLCDGSKVLTSQAGLQKSAVNIMNTVPQNSFPPANCPNQSSATDVTVSSSQSALDHSQQLIITESPVLQDNLQLLSVTAINTQSALSLQPLDLPGSPVFKKNDTPSFELKPNVQPDGEKTVLVTIHQDEPLREKTNSENITFNKQEQGVESVVALTNQQTEVDLRSGPDPDCAQRKSPCHKDSDTDSGCDEGPELDKALQDGPDSLALPLMLSPNQSNVMYAENMQDVGCCFSNCPTDRKFEPPVDSKPAICAGNPDGADTVLKVGISADVVSVCSRQDGAGQNFKDAVLYDGSGNAGQIPVSSDKNDTQSANGDIGTNAADNGESPVTPSVTTCRDKCVPCEVNDMQCGTDKPQGCVQVSDAKVACSNVLTMSAQDVKLAVVSPDNKEGKHSESSHQSHDLGSAELSEEPQPKKVDEISAAESQQSSVLSATQTEQLPQESSGKSTDLLSHCVNVEMASENGNDTTDGAKEGVKEFQNGDVKEEQNVCCDSKSAVGESKLSGESCCFNSADNDEKKQLTEKPVRITRSMRQRMEYEAWMKERGVASQQDNEDENVGICSDMMEGKQIKKELTDEIGNLEDPGASSNKSSTDSEQEVKLEMPTSSCMFAGKEHSKKAKRPSRISKENIQGSATDDTSTGEVGSHEEIEENASPMPGVQSKKTRHSVNMIRQPVQRLTRRHSSNSVMSSTSDSSSCSTLETQVMQGNTSAPSSLSVKTDCGMCAEGAVSEIQNKEASDTRSKRKEVKVGEADVHLKNTPQDQNDSKNLTPKCHVKSFKKEGIKLENREDISVGNSNTSEENSCDSEGAGCDKARANRPKPISYIEESDFDFQSVVARAVKAWSKPSGDQKKCKSEKSGSEKTKSLDVLLSRKKMTLCSVEKVTKSQQKSKPKPDICELNAADESEQAESTKESVDGQTYPATSGSNDKLQQSDSVKGSDSHWQQPFSVKWKTFGKRPQEVNIKIPLDITETPTSKQSDTVQDGGSEVETSECSQLVQMDGGSDQSVNQETERDLKIVTCSQAEGTSALPAQGQEDQCQSVNVSGGQSKGDSNEPEGISVMDLSTDSPGRADFMEYHKELHDMVVGEEMDVFLSDEADLLLNDTDSKLFLDLNLCNDSLENPTLQAGNEVGCLQDGHYICPFCDDERSFRFEYNLTSHLKCVHGVVKEEPHQAADLWCPICKDLPPFDELLMLLYHMRAVHDIANFDVGSRSTRSPVTSLASQQISRAPTVQEPSDSTQQNLKSAGAKELKFGSPKSDVEVYSDVESTCSDVSNVTGITSIESGISLEEEFISKHPELAAKVVSAQRVCSSCNIAFLKMGHYKSHVLRYHTMEQKALQWRCGICSKLFLQHDEWRQHLYQHFPSRKGAKHRSITLTSAEKQVLREEACRECKRPAPVTQPKSAGRAPVAGQNCSADESNVKPSPVNKWDELFGLETDVERLDKVARTYSRNSLSASKKSIQTSKCRHSPDSEESSAPDSAIPKSNQHEKNNELMEPLSVSIPNDEIQNNQSDICSNSQAGIVSCSQANASPNSVTSSVSKTEKISPVSVSSNPEMSTRSLHSFGKRRHSCDGSDTQHTLETRNCSLKAASAKDTDKGAAVSSLKRELRSNNVAASKDKENSSQSKGSTNQTSPKKSCAKLDLVTSRRSGSRLRNASRNTKHTIDMKCSVQCLSRAPDLCWKLPWEHYLRNTLRKQVSSGKKSSQASAEDGKSVKSRSVQDRQANCGQTASKKKSSTNKSIMPKDESGTTTKSPSRQPSSAISSSPGPVSRRRRFSLSSSGSVGSSVFPKRRRTESQSDGPPTDPAVQPSIDGIVSPRRLSTRLNHTKDVKGMALHTRSAEHVVTSRSTRKTQLKNKK